MKVAGGGGGLRRAGKRRRIGCCCCCCRICRVGPAEFDLPSRICRVGSAESDLLSRICRVGPAESDLPSRICRVGSSESDLSSRIFRVGSSESDLPSRICRVGSSESDLPSRHQYQNSSINTSSIVLQELARPISTSGESVLQVLSSYRTQDQIEDFLEGRNISSEDVRFAAPFSFRRPTVAFCAEFAVSSAQLTCFSARRPCTGVTGAGVYQCEYRNCMA